MGLVAAGANRPNMQWVKDTVESMIVLRPKPTMCSQCEASSSEKPGAVIPHAGICEGAV